VHYTQLNAALCFCSVSLLFRLTLYSWQFVRKRVFWTEWGAVYIGNIDSLLQSSGLLFTHAINQVQVTHFHA
jgi:hypothetical protein